jgi:hypothetical protein
MSNNNNNTNNVLTRASSTSARSTIPVVPPSTANQSISLPSSVFPSGALVETLSQQQEAHAKEMAELKRCLDKQQQEMQSMHEWIQKRNNSDLDRHPDDDTEWVDPAHDRDVNSDGEEEGFCFSLPSQDNARSRAKRPNDADIQHISSDDDEERDKDEAVQEGQDHGDAPMTVGDIKDVLSSLSKSQQALVTLAQKNGAKEDADGLVDITFVEQVPKKKELRTSTKMPTSPLLVEPHLVKKLHARVEKWDSLPSKWDLKELNKRLAREVPSTHPIMTRETAAFLHTTLRALLLSSADIEKACYESNGDAVVDAVADMRWLIAAAFSKTTKELFHKAYYDKSTGKKRDAGKILEAMAGLEEHKEYLIVESNVNAAVFLATNFNSEARREAPRGPAQFGKGKPSSSFQFSKRPRFANNFARGHAGAPSSHGLQHNLAQLGAGVNSSFSADAYKGNNYKGNNYNPNYRPQQQPARKPAYSGVAPKPTSA